MCATGSEAFRNACYAVASGAYDLVMAIGVEKLKDSGFSGLVTSTIPGNGTAAALTAPALFSFLAPAYAQQVRRGRGRDEGRPDPDRVEEPQERRPQPAGPVPEGSGEGRHPQLAAHRRAARDLRLLRGERRLGRRHHLPGRGRPPLHRPPAVREGAVVRGRPGGRAARPRLRLHHLHRGGPRRRGRLPPSRRVDDPRAELAMAEVHDCFTPTELVLMEDLGLRPAGHGMERGAGRHVRPRRRAGRQPRRRAEELRSPDRRQRAADAVRVLAAAAGRGRGPPDRQRQEARASPTTWAARPASASASSAWSGASLRPRTIDAAAMGD